jgi:hypothetical protein
MSTRATLAALAALAIATPGMAAVDVRVTGQSIDVQASNAPLSEILERLSRQTQMKVVYDGAPPRQTVTLDLRGRTLVEAVVAALEGQGVNYALAMDASGTRVQTLLVSGTATASVSSRASASLEDRRSAAREMPPEPVVEESEPVAEEEPQAAPADTSAGLNLPTGGAQQGKDGSQLAEPVAPAVPDAGLGGFSASPFAPQAAKPQPPQPQATPPPFNP